MFRERGVRLVMVNDGFDSDNGEGDDFTPFREIMAEWYARDTSKKIKSMFAAKAKSGKPTTSTQPYGFVKDVNDKNKWLVDPEAAAVVKRIFQMTIDGMGVHTIAGMLAAEKLSGHHSISVPVTVAGTSMIMTAANHMHGAEFVAKFRETSVIKQGETAKSHRKQIAKNENRLAELDKIFRSLYEDKALSKISEEMYEDMSFACEQERSALREKTESLQSELDAFNADS